MKYSVMVTKTIFSVAVHKKLILLFPKEVMVTIQLASPPRICLASAASPQLAASGCVPSVDSSHTAGGQKSGTMWSQYTSQPPSSTSVNMSCVIKLATVREEWKCMCPDITSLNWLFNESILSEQFPISRRFVTFVTKSAEGNT